MYNFKVNDEFEYELLLCKKSKEVIAEIPQEYLTNLVLKFNDMSELTLDIPKFIQNSRMKVIENPLYELINESKIITLDSKYAFKINSISEREDSELNIVKTISATTIEKQLQQRNFTMNGLSRQIYKNSNDTVHVADGVLNFFEDEVLSWKVGYVDANARDESIGGAAPTRKYRWLDATVVNWYNFIKTTLSSSYKCLFLFDSYNELLDVYDENSIGEDKGLVLSYDNFVKGITKTTDIESFVTKLRILGRDGMTVNSVNPTGEQYIEDYRVVMDEMSSALKESLIKYYKILDDVHLQWLIKRNELIDKNKEKNRCNDDITAIKESIKALKALQTQYIKNDDSRLAQTTANLQTKENELNSKLQTLNTINSQIDAINKQIETLANQINKQTCTDGSGQKVFTSESIKELDRFTIEGDYNDETFLTEEALMDGGKKYLEELQTPKIEFSVDVVDFLTAIKSKTYWDNRMSLGDFVWIESHNFGEQKVRLVGITHNVNTHNLSLTFSNKAIQYEPIKLSGALTNSANASATVQKNKQKWNDYVVETDFVKGVREAGLDLATAMVNGRGATNRIWLDEYGLMMQDITDENNMLYISSGLIAISTDGFRTSRTAITPDGVIGETIVGKILLGEELYISDKSGVITIRDGVMSITDNREKLRVKLGKLTDTTYGLKLYDSTGNETVLDDSGMIGRMYSHYSENLDASNPFVFPMNFDAGVGAIKSFNVTINPTEFRSYSKGVDGGGATVTSTGGSGSATASTSNNGTVSTSTGGGGSYSGGSSTGNGGSASVNTSANVPTWLESPVTGVNAESGNSSGYHYHSIDSWKLSHNHSVSVTVPSHSHTFSVSIGSHSHSIDIGNHTHTVNIDGHTHAINIPDHNHAMQHGIFKSSKASNVYIKVNGQTIKQGIYSQTTVDIAPYLNAQGNNTIEIGSGSLGRVEVSISAKIFSRW